MKKMVVALSLFGALSSFGASNCEISEIFVTENLKSEVEMSELITLLEKKNYIVDLNSEQQEGLRFTLGMEKRSAGGYAYFCTLDSQVYGESLVVRALRNAAEGILCFAKGATNSVRSLFKEDAVFVEIEDRKNKVVKPAEALYFSNGASPSEIDNFLKIVMNTVGKCDRDNTL